MRCAVLSDIHANLAALDAVLAEVRAEGIERLILLGDYVGYYYEPQRVVDRLRSFAHEAVRGNHDRMLLEARVDPSTRASYLARYGSGVDCALAQLDGETWAWLEALPDRLEVEICGQRILLCHGSPLDPDCYVYPNSAPELLEGCAAPGCAATWMGHTHWPFLRPGSPWLLNPGSVGQARDLGGLAAWCIYDGERRSVAFRRTEYDARPLADEARRRDPGRPVNATVLSRRRLKPEAAHATS
jgi:putative phosphoesterase